MCYRGCGFSCKAAVLGVQPWIMEANFTALAMAPKSVISIICVFKVRNRRGWMLIKQELHSPNALIPQKIKEQLYHCCVIISSFLSFGGPIFWSLSLMICDKKDSDVVSDVYSPINTNAFAYIHSAVGNEVKRWIWCAGRVVSCSLRGTHVLNCLFCLSQAQWPMRAFKTWEGTLWGLEPDVCIWTIFLGVVQFNLLLGDIIWLQPGSVMFPPHELFVFNLLQCSTTRGQHVQTVLTGYEHDSLWLYLSLVHKDKNNVLTAVSLMNWQHLLGGKSVSTFTSGMWMADLVLAGSVMDV